MQSSSELNYLNESIRVYPDVIGDLIDKTLVVGDLHGNAMKALYILLRYRVLSLNDKALFDEAWAIYDKTTDDLTAEDLARFEEIVNQAEVCLPGLINFIGDEYADRGKNDYFTALIFQKLHDNHVPYRIQVSNHGSYLLYYTETGSRLSPELNLGQLESLDNYIALKNRLPSIESKFNQLIEHAYKDHLCLIGYAQPVGEPLYLFTHAPIDEITLQSLAAFFNVTYDSSSLENLVSSIDKINAVAIDLIQKDKFSCILESTSYMQSSKIKANDASRHAVYQILWNRYPIRCELPCEALNIHGHVGDFELVPPFSQSHYNIDSDWGKPTENGYDPTTNSEVVVPADDHKSSLMLLTQVSPQDRLSVFYRNAAPNLSVSSVIIEQPAVADLTSADLTSADLTSADLTSADLTSDIVNEQDSRLFKRKRDDVTTNDDSAKEGDYPNKKFN